MKGKFAARFTSQSVESESDGMRKKNTHLFRRALQTKITYNFSFVMS